MATLLYAMLENDFFFHIGYCALALMLLACSMAQRSMLQGESSVKDRLGASKKGE